MTSENAKYVGMDVGKSWLDVAVWGEAKSNRVSNDREGVSELVEQMSELEPALVVVEATGGYERLAVEELFSSGFPVSVANPTRVRALAKATGKLAKTDDIDAALIAEYAAKVQPAPVASKTESELHLRALVTRREQLLEMRTAEKNRLKTAYRRMKVDIGEHIDWISARIQELESEMLRLIQSLPDWQEQVQLMESIPGIGFITAITILAELPELGRLNRQKIAALAGLAWPPSTGIVARNAANGVSSGGEKGCVECCIWPVSLQSNITRSFASSISI